MIRCALHNPSAGFVALSLTILAGCSNAPNGGSPSQDSGTTRTDAGMTTSDGGGMSLPPPPATWREHWFEHDQELQLAYYNDSVAVYFDSDVNRAGTDWLLPFLTRLWN